MSPVSFDEETITASRSHKGGSSISSWLIQSGFAKTESQANMFLMIVAGVVVLIAIGVWLYAQTTRTREYVEYPASHNKIPGPENEVR